MKEYVVRKAFPRPEWHKGASHAKIRGGRMFQAEWTANAKVLRQE